MNCETSTRLLLFFITVSGCLSAGEPPRPGSPITGGPAMDPSQTGPQSSNGATAGIAAASAEYSMRCAQGDFVCEKERFAFEAIKDLHGQLDDDKNGDIDTTESEGFLRNELQYKSLDKRRSDNFHHNDSHITVDDLWQSWHVSEVHNWTIEQVAAWMTSDVEMPQHVQALRFHNVDGATLPRLAVNHLNFVTSVLGIKNPVSRQKLSLKAMDVVLFGPPRRGHSVVKDALLVTAIAIAIGGIWFARNQYRTSQANLSRWEADLRNLQSLQQRLVHEKQEKEHLTANQLELEAKIKAEIEEAKAEAENLRQRRLHTDTELARLKMAEDELLKVREVLSKAEQELEMHRSGHSASSELQCWLQITYELEQRSYLEKKASAEAQLASAKKECEKLTKKQNAFLGSLRMAHAHSFDELEFQIAEARQALEEVKLDLTELQHRWRAIERASGMQVETNPGLAVLLATTGHVAPQHDSHAKRAGGAVPLPDADVDDELFGSVSASSESLRDSGSVSPSKSEPSGLGKRTQNASSCALPGISSDLSGFGDKRSASAHDLPASSHGSGSRQAGSTLTPPRLLSAEQRDSDGRAATGGGLPADDCGGTKKSRPSLLVGLTKLRGAKAAASKAVKERSLHTS